MSVLGKNTVGAGFYGTGSIERVSGCERGQRVFTQPVFQSAERVSEVGERVVLCSSLGHNATHSFLANHLPSFIPSI